MDCPFCSLTSLDLVYESKLVVGLQHAAGGRTLIVPRRHIAAYFDASSDEKAALWRAAEAIKLDLDAALRPDGVNVEIHEATAGEPSAHLSVHIIPSCSADADAPRGETGSFAALPRFVGGAERHFVEAIRGALHIAERAELLVAFVQPSGVELLRANLDDAATRGVRIRVLTGDYLGITSPDALRTLFHLSEKHEGFEAALYETEGGGAFHPKSYIFRAGEGGIAYVGSSNLSGSALKGGIEWNLRSIEGQGRTLDEISAEFERLWSEPQARLLSPALIREYEARVPVPVAPLREPREAGPTPNLVQREALAALKATRRENNRRGLVVLATGLGKTYLSAFDLQQTGWGRALFVAHREEILEQAKETWAKVLPERSLGTYGAGRHERDADIVFASVQTLSRERHTKWKRSS